MPKRKEKARKKKYHPEQPKPYKARTAPLPGTRHANVAPQARTILRNIAKHTKRRPYIRSAWFKKDKIFFTHFWTHLTQKPISEQIRRLKLLPCAIEVIRKSRQEPTIKQNVDRKYEILFRFAGITRNNTLFFVQIKHNTRTNRKEFMSVFAPNKKFPA